jgi:hypothetical protein
MGLHANPMLIVSRWASGRSGKRANNVGVALRVSLVRYRASTFPLVTARSTLRFTIQAS